MDSSLYPRKQTESFRTEQPGNRVKTKRFNTTLAKKESYS